MASGAETEESDRAPTVRRVCFVYGQSRSQYVLEVPPSTLTKDVYEDLEKHFDWNGDPLEDMPRDRNGQSIAVGTVERQEFLLDPTKFTQKRLELMSGSEIEPGKIVLNVKRDRRGLSQDLVYTSEKKLGDLLVSELILGKFQLPKTKKRWYVMDFTEEELGLTLRELDLKEGQRYQVTISSDEPGPGNYMGHWEVRSEDVPLSNGAGGGEGTSEQRPSTIQKPAAAAETRLVIFKDTNGNVSRITYQGDGRVTLRSALEFSIKKHKLYNAPESYRISSDGTPLELSAVLRDVVDDGATIDLEDAEEEERRVTLKDTSGLTAPHHYHEYYNGIKSTLRAAVETFIAVHKLGTAPESYRISSAGKLLELSAELWEAVDDGAVIELMENTTEGTRSATPPRPDQVEEEAVQRGEKRNAAHGDGERRLLKKGERRVILKDMHSCITTLYVTKGKGMTVQEAVEKHIDDFPTCEALASLAILKYGKPLSLAADLWNVCKDSDDDVHIDLMERQKGGGH